VTSPRHKPRQPLITDGTAGEKFPAEMSELYDPPDLEDHWPAGRPAYLVVVDQLRGWRPADPPSLAEILENQLHRSREPDLEAEP
jgi:hypothetical protein